MTELSNIEKYYAGAGKGLASRNGALGGYAKAQKLQARKQFDSRMTELFRDGDTQQLVKGILMGDLPEAERDYVRSFVPDSVPNELISPLVAMLYSSINRAVMNGDASILERLLRAAGETPELKLKIGNLDDRPFETIDLTVLTDDELQHMAYRYTAADAEMQDIVDEA